jgi:hypothetical protein
MSTIIIACFLFAASAVSAGSLLNEPVRIVDAWIQADFEPNTKCTLRSVAADDIRKLGNFKSQAFPNVRINCDVDSVDEACLSAARADFGKRYRDQYEKYDCKLKESSAQEIATNLPKLNEVCSPKEAFHRSRNVASRIQMKFDEDAIAARAELVGRSAIQASEIKSFKIQKKVCYADVSCSKGFQQRGKSFEAGDYRIYCSPMCEGMSECTDKANNCHTEYFEDMCDNAWVQKKSNWKAWVQEKLTLRTGPKPIKVGPPTRDTSGEEIVPTKATTSKPKGTP